MRSSLFLPVQVVAGSKTFTLLPPADIFRMRLRQYASATYKPQGSDAASQVGREVSCVHAL